MKVETSKTPSYLLRRYKWSNIIVVFIWHVLALAAYYHNFFNSLKLNTLIFGAIISISGGIGIVVGKCSRFEGVRCLSTIYFHPNRSSSPVGS